MLGRRLACTVLLGSLTFGIAGGAIAQDDSQPSASAWEFLRSKYYGDQSMGLVDEDIMSIEVPANTPDPAATPVTLRLSDDAHRRVKRVRVFIDNNPSPLVATFDFARTPITEIDMHVRVDRFTSVRAVAEMADGGLEMRSAWVKASGGCSAPPADSSQAGALGISVSENPTFRIASDQHLPLPLSVDAVDSVTQAHYTGSTEAGTPGAEAATASRSAMNASGER
jgi:predicted secreted protein